MDKKKKWSEIVLEERKKGNVVCTLLPDEWGTISVKEIIKQPVDGLLWDLNRLEEVALTFMDDPSNPTWVNNFAVALVIRELHGQVAALKAENERAKKIMEKFVSKVESGRARSKETYVEMKDWLELAEESKR
jgi:hypothetical protein